MKTMETERLILRAWSHGDLDDLYEYAIDPEVGPDAGWQPHSDKDVTAGVLKKFMESDCEWAVEYRENHKVIGLINLHADRKRDGVNVQSIGFVLAREYWGRGLMSEAVRRLLPYAFEDAGLDMVSICHYPFNQRSRRVIEKCGFTYEGTIRMAKKLPDGRILDEVCYSMTREDYFANNRKQ